MAKSPEEIATMVEATGGKKAKRKALKKAPESTKELKLPKDVRDGLEKHFGAKLAKVRVHTGGNIKELCKELKAKAFTQGHNVYFMRPGDAKKPETLVHELAHVLQQSRGKVPKPKDGEALIAK
ncbi:DUF4157 domain-containing protein [Parasedimentitalea huanghaiensis]|uniref:DUF4157 domain-containing protein n=1 Tax=Parasedimentitalea huanghaiensis TaxID=2682100 RepID=A0A6L6WIM4_9RHOB|nr:DUF4157 domain-containing protein [Zongyanglinia huanghaiensis]MVO17181.1 DUF4157 domain-containing protein [Zongyanglinia huanghaiensis]